MKKMIRRKKNKSRAISILMAFAMVVTLLGGIAPISVKASQPNPEKGDVIITGNNQTTTYDGKSYDLSQLFTMSEGHGDATYEIVAGGTGAGTISGQELSITALGKINIKVTTADTDQYKVGQGTATLTVRKGKLVRPTGKTLVYNGESQTGVEDGEMYDTVDATGINVGNYSATVKLTDAAKKLYGWNVGSVVSDEDQIILWAIVKAAPRIAVNPTASAITYGESLSKSILSGGKAALGNTEAEVAGSFKWKDDTVKPDMDSLKQKVIFTPTDEGNYESVEFEVSITMNGVTPSIDAAPTASSITYGQSLSESSLTGGTAKVDGDIINGTFTWKDRTLVPEVGSSQQTVIFTPESNNYSTVELNVPISVNKVTLNPLVASVAQKTYDGTMSCSGTLSFEGGVGNEVPTASGTFTWTKSSAGTNTVDVTGITLDEVWKNKYQLATTELKDALTPAVAIAPRPAEIIWDYSKAFVYSGERQYVIPTVNNVIGSDVVNPITEHGSASDVGNYTAKVTQLSNADYTLEGASGTTLDWQILGIDNPVISGVVNGETYFTTQVATITGDQVTSVTLNGNPVSTKVVALMGNREQKYNIVATNALGIKSEITITMKPISTLAESINALNVGNVKSSDRAAVEATKAKVSSIDITNATQEEQAALKSIVEKCDSLIAKMNQIDKDTKAAETSKDKKTQAKKVKGVATGDSSNFTGVLLLSIFALLVAGGCIVRRKKQ